MLQDLSTHPSTASARNAARTARGRLRVFTDKIMMRTADRPEGPWSAPTLAFQTASDQDYAGVEQSPLATDCGRKTLVTYYHRQGPWSGELHAVEITLR